MRKAQVSMEFVILMTFMILIFTVVFVVIQQKAVNMQDSLTGKQAQEVANIMKNEIEMAHTAVEGYRKEFWIPDYINGEEYEITIKDRSELMIKYKKQLFVSFLVANITGNIHPEKGYHIIANNRNNITISPGKL